MAGVQGGARGGAACAIAFGVSGVELEKLADAADLVRLWDEKNERDLDFSSGIGGIGIGMSFGVSDRGVGEGVLDLESFSFSFWIGAERFRERSTDRRSVPGSWATKEISDVEYKSKL